MYKRNLLSTSMDELWHQSFFLGDTWHNASVTVHLFEGVIVFRAISGGARGSNIGLDNIFLTPGECSGNTLF